MPTVIKATCGVFVFLRLLCFPVFAEAQETEGEGWAVPNLNGFIPYSISISIVDGVEKITERFYTPDGGHVARLSGNGKVFAYAIDKDQEPPADYLLLDLEGSGKFRSRLGPFDSYPIPVWVSE